MVLTIVLESIVTRGDDNYGFLSAACGGGTLWVLRGSSGRERRLVGGRKELSQQIARVPYDSQRARCFSRSSVAGVFQFFLHIIRNFSGLQIVIIRIGGRSMVSTPCHTLLGCCSLFLFSMFSTSC